MGCTSSKAFAQKHSRGNTKPQPIEKRPNSDEEGSNSEKQRHDSEEQTLKSPISLDEKHSDDKKPSSYASDPSVGGTTYQPNTNSNVEANPATKPATNRPMHPAYVAPPVIHYGAGANTGGSWGTGFTGDVGCSTGFSGESGSGAASSGVGCSTGFSGGGCSGGFGGGGCSF